METHAVFRYLDHTLFHLRKNRLLRCYTLDYWRFTVYEGGCFSSEGGTKSAASNDVFLSWIWYNNVVDMIVAR